MQPCGAAKSMPHTLAVSTLLAVLAVPLRLPPTCRGERCKHHLCTAIHQALHRSGPWLHLLSLICSCHPHDVLHVRHSCFCEHSQLLRRAEILAGRGSLQHALAECGGLCGSGCGCLQPPCQTG